MMDAMLEKRNLSWRIAGAVLLASVPLAGGASAADARCPSRPELLRPVVDVKTDVPRASYRYDLSIADLTRYKQQQGSNAGGHTRTLGLTYAMFETRFSFETLSQRVGRGYCHWVKRVDATLRIPQLQVFVARDYRPGTCQFHVVTEHENEHVRINQNLVTKFGPLLRYRVVDALHRGMPIWSSERDGGKAVGATLSPLVNQLVAEMYRERDRNNGAIDTAEAYARTARRCNNW